jgi:hypothetical protein
MIPRRTGPAQPFLGLTCDAGDCGHQLVLAPKHGTDGCTRRHHKGIAADRVPDATVKSTGVVGCDSAPIAIRARRGPSRSPGAALFGEPFEVQQLPSRHNEVADRDGAGQPNVPAHHDLQ